MDTLFRIHSDLRWLVVILGILAIIRLAIGLFGRQPYDRWARLSTLLFSISIDIQVLVGFVYLIWQGIEHDLWPRERFEHMAVMIVALIIAHLPMRWRNALPITRYRNDLVAVIVALIVIFVGVVALPGGTARWEP